MPFTINNLFEKKNGMNENSTKNHSKDFRFLIVLSFVVPKLAVTQPATLADGLHFQREKKQLKKAFFQFKFGVLHKIYHFFPSKYIFTRSPLPPNMKDGPDECFFFLLLSLLMHNKCAQFALPYVSHPDNLMAAKKAYQKR